MAKKAKQLTALDIQRLTPREGVKKTEYAVGGVSGLLIQCYPESKQWILRVTIEGQRHRLGLGAYPDITLKTARELARELKEKIKKGENPAKERKKAKARKIYLFSEIAEQYHKIKVVPESGSVKNQRLWINSIKNYAYPVIGDLNIEDIETAHIINVLEPIWLTKTETARRLRQKLEAVFNFAMASNIIERGFNPASLKGNLDQLLPNVNKSKKTKDHHPALKPELINQFLKDLRNYQGISARALEFIILTACRSGEARLATWNEIDFKNKVWTIPADRMKAGKPHTVPLSEQALNLLASLPKLSEYVFTAPRGGALSDMAVNNVIRKLDKKGKTYTDETTGRLIVPHGFRSTFKDWCRQPQRYGHVNYSDELSELALAHVNSDATRSAYARNELLEERRPLMSDWAKFCEGVKSVGEVVEMRRA